MEAPIVYWGYLGFRVQGIGIMEKKMEAPIVHWGYLGFRV